MSLEKLQELLGDGLSVEQGALANLTQRKVIGVSVHVGRHTGKVSLPVKQVGMKLDLLEKEAKSFYQERMSGSDIKFIPPDDLRAFDTIEARLRNCVKQMALVGCSEDKSGGQNKGKKQTIYYIPAEAHGPLKVKAAQIISEYNARRDKVLGEWDDLEKAFIEGVDEMLKGFSLLPAEHAKLKDSLIKSMPKKHEYAQSFYMVIEPTAFPAYAAPEGLDSALASAIDTTTRNNLYTFALQAIEQSIGSAFVQVCKFWDAFSRQSFVSGRTIDSMVRLVCDLGYKNVFQNELLTVLRGKLDRIVKEENPIDRQEMVEDALLDIWEYAQKTGIQLDTSCLPQASTGSDVKLTPADLDQEVKSRALAMQSQMKIELPK